MQVVFCSKNESTHSSVALIMHLKCVSWNTMIIIAFIINSLSKPLARGLSLILKIDLILTRKL